MDQSNYVILPQSSFSPFITTSTIKEFIPSEKDIQHSIEILSAFLEHRTEILELREYKIQFSGYINETGEKIIRANYFCNAIDIDWKNTPVLVKGGGNCFFNVKVNLDKKDVFDFIVNARK